MTERYFEIIDTEDKAYWLGFLYADGCVSNDLHYLTIDLSTTDIEHIEKFKNEINAHQKISISSTTDGISHARLHIGCKIMCNDLVKKGCVPRKSLVLTFPSEDILPRHLVPHFIRGYFDGDGGLSTFYAHRKDRPNPQFHCELSFLGTTDMLEHIKSYINMDSEKIYKVGNIYKFRVQTKQKIIQICEYLYKDSHCYLERKYNKYITQIKI